MTAETSNRITYDASNLDGQITVDSSQIQAVQITPPPIIAITGQNGRPLVAVHPDGRLEYGDGYTPDDAAQAFWDAVERLSRNLQYGAPLNASIDAELAAGQRAQDTLKTLAPMLQGLDRLLTTSSRDWGEYRVDAWLWAVICGWDCEETEHNGSCVHGSMEEMAQRHGWSPDAVAKARRYRSAVRAVQENAEDAG